VTYFFLCEFHFCDSTKHQGKTNCINFIQKNKDFLYSVLLNP
jgi:hypothetical protein